MAATGLKKIRKKIKNKSLQEDLSLWKNPVKLYFSPLPMGETRQELLAKTPETLKL